MSIKCRKCRHIVSTGMCRCRCEYEKKLKRFKQTLQSIPASTFTARQILNVLEETFGSGIYFDENNEIRGTLRHLDRN